MKRSVQLLAVGMILIIVGAFLKIQKIDYSNSLLSAGLVLESIGIVAVSYTIITQKRSS